MMPSLPFFAPVKAPDYLFLIALYTVCGVQPSISAVLYITCHLVKLLYNELTCSYFARISSGLNFVGRAIINFLQR